jgi:hypothetical protein
MSMNTKSGGVEYSNEFHKVNALPFSESKQMHG